MKRKHLDRRGWRRLNRQTTHINRIEHPNAGWISLIEMESVKEPLHVVNCDRKLKVADDGYQWLHFMPDHEEYVMTAMIDNNGKLVQIYFDIVWQTGYDKKNDALWFDDLYLDVVLMPDGHYCLLDEDELIEAKEAGHITEEMFQHAYKMAQKLMDEIEVNYKKFLDLSFKLIPGRSRS